jgi:hypothetical protein
MAVHAPGCRRLQNTGLHASEHGKVAEMIQKCVDSIRLQLAIMKEIIFKLDQA